MMELQCCPLLQWKSSGKGKVDHLDLSVAELLAGIQHDQGWSPVARRCLAAELQTMGCGYPRTVQRCWPDSHNWDRFPWLYGG